MTRCTVFCNWRWHISKFALVKPLMYLFLVPHWTGPTLQWTFKKSPNEYNRNQALTPAPCPPPSPLSLSLQPARRQQPQGLKLQLSPGQQQGGSGAVSHWQQNIELTKLLWITVFFPVPLFQHTIFWAEEFSGQTSPLKKLLGNKSQQRQHVEDIKILIIVILGPHRSSL